MDDISLARWRKSVGPADSRPRDALVAALNALDIGECEMSHCIVTYAGPDGILGWFQAGNETHYGQLGLLTRAVRIMGDDE